MYLITLFLNWKYQQLQIECRLKCMNQFLLALRHEKYLNLQKCCFLTRVKVGVKAVSVKGIYSLLVTVLPFSEDNVSPVLSITFLCWYKLNLV